MAPTPENATSWSSDSFAYRILPSADRRVSPGQPGTLGQQLQAITTYHDVLDPSMTSTAKARLWVVCHALATDRPITMEVRQ